MSLSKKIALTTANLTKSFGTLIAVDNVSFTIEEGSIVGVLGPNGAGKTTMIRLITGIFELESTSQVKINSSDLTHSPKLLKKEFGIVPEVSNAFLDFSVWQNLTFAGTIYGLSKAQIKEKAQELLKRFDLENKIHDKTKTLSEGLKQRLNVCLALLHNPSIIILDEPMSGLDPFSVDIVRNQILELKREGKTILLTTHNMQEAQKVCDRVLIMNKGKIIADQSPEDLLKKIKPYTNLSFKINTLLSQEQNNELKSIFQFIELKNDQVNIVSSNPLRDIKKFNDFVEKYDLSVSNFKLIESTLEEVFIHLIKNDTLGGVGNETH
ncbi:MAG: ABC transporter ATP-binding protein [Candidatus Lokiarchaeota archaeon]|nr:ABC transporter ATP-binding protein [Candidatus Lokiarchaeota archaeon]